MTNQENMCLKHPTTFHVPESTVESIFHLLYGEAPRILINLRGKGLLPITVEIDEDFLHPGMREMGPHAARARKFIKQLIDTMTHSGRNEAKLTLNEGSITVEITPVGDEPHVHVNVQYFYKMTGLAAAGLYVLNTGTPPRRKAENFTTRCVFCISPPRPFNLRINIEVRWMDMNHRNPSFATIRNYDQMKRAPHFQTRIVAQQPAGPHTCLTSIVNETCNSELSNRVMEQITANDSSTDDEATPTTSHFLMEPVRPRETIRRRPEADHENQRLYNLLTNFNNTLRGYTQASERVQRNYVLTILFIVLAFAFVSLAAIIIFLIGAIGL